MRLHVAWVASLRDGHDTVRKKGSGRVAHTAEKIFQQLVLLEGKKTNKPKINKPHQTNTWHCLVFRVWPLFLATIDGMYEENSLKLALCLTILIHSVQLHVCVYEGHSF